MIKAVIFDMFETLASLFEGGSYFSEDMAADLGIPEKEFKAAWHRTEEGRTTGKYSMSEAAGIVLKDVGAYSEAGVALITGKRMRNLEGTFSADLSESVAMLKRLKDEGYLVGLISNCYSDERDMIKKSPMYPYFDVVCLSYETGICKPDERIFRLCAEKLGVSLDECLYVGDGGSDELITARKLGMKAIQCQYYHHLAYEPHIPCGVLPDFEHIHEKSELFDHLR